MNIGVLALQDCAAQFPGLHVFEVRTACDINNADGLILPGGESTAMRIIAQSKGDLFGKLRDFVRAGKPVWGTCAGCIILSDHVSSKLGGGSNNSVEISTVKGSELYGDQFVGGADISTCRNFFGRQNQSFETLSSSDDGKLDKFPAVFIRAPAIVDVGENAKVIATIDHNNEKIVVAAQQANLLVTCFHPELTQDLRYHKYFLSLVKSTLKNP